jgi:exodeoxyribonuclease V alpha subunit
LADAIRDNQPNEVMALLRNGATDPVTNTPLLTFIDHVDALGSAAADELRELIVAPCLVAREAALGSDGEAALRELAGIRVLCAHRYGPHGAHQWNRTIESWLLGSTSHATFYPGRALLVTRNDPRTHLSNGDTGVVVAHPDGVRAAFGLGPNGDVREFAPAQLEQVETAFAMTIHKSQGSEYATVVVVLPPATSPLIGRELLYTAITRTTRRLVVVGTEAAVIKAVQTPARRVTGLAAALRAHRG